MNTRDFDDIIKQKAQGRKAVVPPDIWDNITAKKKKRRKPFGWLVFAVLLIGAGAVVWQMNTRHVPVAADESNDHNNNNTTKVAVINDAQQNNGQQAIGNRQNTGNAGETMPGTNEQTLADVKATDKTDTVGNKVNQGTVKRQPVSNATTGKANKKIVATRRQQQNTKGKYKVTITNGSTGEPTDNTEEKDITAAIETNTAEPQSNKSDQASPPNNIATGTLATGNNDEKKATLPTVADSTTVKKQVLTDSSNLNKKEIAASKKTATQQKGKGLKIEASIGTVFPVQQYDKPLSVQRVLSTRNINSVFNSNDITTRMETGIGLSVSLVKQLNTRWSIGAGISYLGFTEYLELAGKETTTTFTIVQRLKQGPNGPYLQPDTISTYSTYSSTLKARNKYHNIGLPIFARYRLIGGSKFSCELATGITVNLIRKYKNNIPGQFTITTAAGDQQSDRENSIGLDAFAALYFSGRLYRNYQWLATTSYSYTLSPYKTSSLSFNKKIHFPGVAVGVSYGLKRR